MLLSESRGYDLARCAVARASNSLAAAPDTLANPKRTLDQAVEIEQWSAFGLQRLLDGHALVSGPVRACP